MNYIFISSSMDRRRKRYVNISVSSVPRRIHISQLICLFRPRFVRRWRPSCVPRWRVQVGAVGQRAACARAPTPHTCTTGSVQKVSFTSRKPPRRPRAMCRQRLTLDLKSGSKKTPLIKSKFELYNIIVHLKLFIVHLAWWFCLLREMWWKDSSSNLVC